MVVVVARMHPGHGMSTEEEDDPAGVGPPPKMSPWQLALWSETTEDTSTWGTPPEAFRPLHREFGFGLDAAALRASALLPWWLGPDHPDPRRRDAFAIDWASARAGGRTGRSSVWLNPPYGRDMGRWISLARAWGAHVTVCAFILARTDTRWWHDEIDAHAAEVRFVRGRVKFIRPDGTPGDAAPAPSVAVIWRPGHVGRPSLGSMVQDRR